MKDQLQINSKMSAILKRNYNYKIEYNSYILREHINHYINTCVSHLDISTRQHVRLILKRWFYNEFPILVANFHKETEENKVKLANYSETLAYVNKFWHSIKPEFITINADIGHIIVNYDINLKPHTILPDGVINIINEIKLANPDDIGVSSHIISYFVEYCKEFVYGKLSREDIIELNAEFKLWVKQEFYTLCDKFFRELDNCDDLYLFIGKLIEFWNNNGFYKCRQFVTKKLVQAIIFVAPDTIDSIEDSGTDRYLDPNFTLISKTKRICSLENTKKIDIPANISTIINHTISRRINNTNQILVI